MGSNDNMKTQPAISTQLQFNGLLASLNAEALERTQIAKYHTKNGHGFSAEDANHFADKISGKQAELVGLNNELNGADRLVDGIRIQSKYFQTASQTIAAAFDSSSGQYRYTDQVLEVPADQYEGQIRTPIVSGAGETPRGFHRGRR